MADRSSRRTFAQLGLVGVVLLTLLSLAMWVQLLTRIPAYRMIFRVMRCGLEFGLWEKWLDRRNRQPAAFGQAVGSRPINVKRQVQCYLANLIRVGARRRPFVGIVRPFFQNTMADSVRIEGQPPASDRLYVLAHQTLTFLSRKTAFAGMDALIIGFKLRQNWGNAAEKPGATETARNLMEAKRAIKETRPIVILGDGRRGDRDVVLPVCGTPMPFQPGFAMIALQFKLPVIFVDSYMDREGRLVYRFSEPLTLDETATADAQIASYIGQYAEKLEGLYREFPGMINPPHRLRFLKFRQEQSIAHTSA